jgi:hypothetical protein
MVIHRKRSRLQYSPTAPYSMYSHVLDPDPAQSVPNVHDIIPK